MIRQLQKRFILIALTALTAAMILAVLLVNAANWISVRNELRETLSFLADSGASGKERIDGGLKGKNRHSRNLISESSWFSVFYDEEGNQRKMNLLNMTDPDGETAETLARQVMESDGESGFLQDWLFEKRINDRGEVLILFLDCETKLTAVRNLALFSAIVCVGGILIAFALVTLASRRAIEPISRNMEQQKQFITNASHELKTPLTVISTNMDLLQMELPDSPWVRSTRKQTAQMQHLVEELVYLSRMEEENTPLSLETLPLDALIQETAEPSAAMAEYQEKTLETKAEEGLTLWGDRASIQRLLSTLLDNAVKYAPAGGHIQLQARREGRYAVLTVANEVSQALTDEQCRQLFDRFYRADVSRSKEKQSGFGIGLAIARAIAEKHGGTIYAAMENNLLVFTCRMPEGGR